MGNFYMESTQINYRRDEKTKTVDQKLQELSETSAIDTDIAPVFKSTNTYQPGDMVYYRNKLYVFNVEHTGTWAAADVTATDVTTEISSLKSGLTNYQTQNDIDLEVPDRKNLLKNTANSATAFGVLYTVNNDGSVSVSTETQSSNISSLLINNFTLPAGKYVLNGCPSGGSSSTYELQIAIGGSTYRDYGDGISFTSTNQRCVVQILIRNGVTINDTFYPMIRPATITDPTFAPYIPSVESRIEAVEVSLVAQSGSTGTIAAKLNSMVSALNALSKDRKRNAVLLMGTTVFHIANTQSNQFTQASYSANTTTTTIRCIDMIANASTYNVARLTTSGVSMENASSTENTTVFYLYA